MRSKVLFLVAIAMNVTFAGEPDLAYPIFTERTFANLYKLTCGGKEVKMFNWTGSANGPDTRCTDDPQFEGNDTIKVPEGKKCFVARFSGEKTQCQGFFANEPVEGGDMIICNLSVFESGKLHLFIRVAKGKQAVIGIKGGSYMYTGTGAWEDLTIPMSANYQLGTHHIIVIYANFHFYYYRSAYKYPAGAKVTNPADEVYLDDVYFFKGDYFHTDVTSSARLVPLEPSNEGRIDNAAWAATNGESRITCFGLQGRAMYSGRADGFVGPSSGVLVLGNNGRRFLVNADQSGRLPHSLRRAD